MESIETQLAQTSLDESKAVDVISAQLDKTVLTEDSEGFLCWQALKEQLDEYVFQGRGKVGILLAYAGLLGIISYHLEVCKKAPEPLYTPMILAACALGQCLNRQDGMIDTLVFPITDKRIKKRLELAAKEVGLLPEGKRGFVTSMEILPIEALELEEKDERLSGEEVSKPEFFFSLTSNKRAWLYI